MYIQVHDALVVLWLNVDEIELGVTAMPGSRSCPLCHPVKIFVSVRGSGDQAVEVLARATLSLNQHLSVQPK